MKVLVNQTGLFMGLGIVRKRKVRDCKEVKREVMCEVHRGLSVVSSKLRSLPTQAGPRPRHANRVHGPLGYKTFQ